MLHAAGREARDCIPQRHGGALRPAARSHERLSPGIDAHVEREADAVRAKPRDPIRHFVRTLHCRTADHDSLDPVAQQIVDDSSRADTAAYLQAHRALRGQGQDDRAIGEQTVLRAVEVDDMQPGSAQTTVSQQQLVRLVLIAGLRTEVALKQAHAASVPQIDRGHQQHAFLRGTIMTGSECFMTGSESS